MAKTKKPKRKIGRPSKFDDVSPRIPLLARNGFTDVEIAKTLDISEDTLTNWKIRYPDFFLSLNDWKHAADKDVVRSLYERAKGYNHPETKVFCKDGEITTHEVTRHYPPDPTSMIFWLKNRDKENWREHQEAAPDRMVPISIYAPDMKMIVAGSPRAVEHKGE